MGKYAGIAGDYYYSKRKWAEDAKKAAEAKGYHATIDGEKDHFHLKVTKVRTGGAKYGVSIMCSTKQRAEEMAGFVRKDGYGAEVVENTGPSSKEYPYLVRRTNRPLKSEEAPSTERRAGPGRGKSARITPKTPRLKR